MGRSVKMDVGYWIPDIQTQKRRIIGYPKLDFSDIGSGSKNFRLSGIGAGIQTRKSRIIGYLKPDFSDIGPGSENFRLSGIGLSDIRSGIPELSDLFSKFNKLYFIIIKCNLIS